MRRLKNICLIIISIIIIYLAISAVVWDFNVGNWPIGARITWAIPSAIILVGCTLLSIEENPTSSTEDVGRK